MGRRGLQSVIRLASDERSSSAASSTKDRYRPTASSNQSSVLELLAPTALLALRSPVALIALPTLTWRFRSANSSYWGIGYHYGAVLMPISAVSSVDGVPAKLTRIALALGWPLRSHCARSCRCAT